jgi:hypothetical protein
MDPTTAFVRSVEAGALEIVINFGPLSGREATQAEVDRLARRLLATADHVRVDAVRTHDVSAVSESIVHQVVVEAAADRGTPRRPGRVRGGRRNAAERSLDHHALTGGV